MTWFIIFWTDDDEPIVFDGVSCNAAYETKYKLTGNAFDEVKYLSCDSVMCSLNHLQNRWYQHFHSSDHKGTNHWASFIWKQKWELNPDKPFRELTDFIFLLLISSIFLQLNFIFLVNCLTASVSSVIWFYKPERLWLDLKQRDQWWAWC